MLIIIILLAVKANNICHNVDKKLYKVKNYIEIYCKHLLNLAMLCLFRPIFCAPRCTEIKG